MYAGGLPPPFFLQQHLLMSANRRLFSYSRPFLSPGCMHFLEGLKET